MASPPTTNARSTPAPSIHAISSERWARSRIIRADRCGTAHTLANFENAFYRSEIADNNSFEQWTEDGALDAPQRANAIWKRMLAEYEAPPIDPAIDEALMEFMIRRKASMPDSEV